MFSPVLKEIVIWVITLFYLQYWHFKIVCQKEFDLIFHLGFTWILFNLCPTEFCLDNAAYVYQTLWYYEKCCLLNGMLLLCTSSISFHLLKIAVIYFPSALWIILSEPPLLLLSLCLKTWYSCWNVPFAAEKQTWADKGVAVSESPPPLQSGRDPCHDLLHHFAAGVGVMFSPVFPDSQPAWWNVCTENKKKKWDHRPAIRAVLRLHWSTFFPKKYIWAKQTG